MALSDELAKITNERYSLIKIIPSLRLNTFLTVKSGTIYECVLSNRFEVSSVKVNGTAYTESATNNPTASKYYYNIDTGVFEINFNAAIGTKEAILFFILRFTDSEYSVFSEAGLKNPTTGAYLWMSRLADVPTFSVSVNDMIAGVASISSSKIEIINNDGFMSDYLGNGYSFSNKYFSATICVNQLVSATIVGSTKAIFINGDVAAIQIYDSFYNLNEICTMGNSNHHSFINYATNSGAAPADIGKCIPYIFGHSTFKYMKCSAITSGQDAYCLDPESTQPALCVNTSANDWDLCRTSSSPAVIDYSSVTSITNNGNVISYGTGTNNAKHLILNYSTIPPDLQIGDSVPLLVGAAGHVGTIINITDTHADVMLNSIGGVAAPAGTYTINGSPTATTNYGVSVILEQSGNIFLLTMLIDYVINSTSLPPTSNYTWYVELSINLTDHPGMITPTNENSKLYFRFREERVSSNYSTHGQVCKRILQAAGLTVNTSSITTADSDLSANVNLMIPELGSTIPRDYNYYLGKLVGSTFGYIYQDNSTLEMKYKLFAEPTTGPFVHGNSIIGLSISFSYDQMAQSIRAYNDANYYQNTVFTSTPPDVISTQISSNKSSYHHGLTNQISQESVLALPYYTAFRRIDYASNMQMFVKISLASNYANLNIGDDLSVYDDRIPGDKATVNGYSCSNLKIIGIDYGSEMITFMTANLRMS